MNTISIILPCYNEEESLDLYFKEVDNYLKSIEDFSFNFILVNDGSTDKTLDVIKRLYDNRDDISYISLSRNFGQVPALLAGLDYSKSDYVIMMDVDLQDPLSLIGEIVSKFKEGYEVVNPHRTNRLKDGFIKRKTASFFYKFINKLEGKTVVENNVNCFRGLSKRVVDEIKNSPEKDKYLLGIIKYVGFKTCTIDFKREERQTGQSKYNLKKMTKYALDNISSTTSNPLYYAIKFTAFILPLSICFFISMLVLFILSYPSIDIITNYSLYSILFIISCCLLFSSVILLFISIISIYLHNILINTRNRKTYIIEEEKRCN